MLEYIWLIQGKLGKQEQFSDILTWQVFVAKEHEDNH